jgi:uncharacterized membrane protein
MTLLAAIVALVLAIRAARWLLAFLFGGLALVFGVGWLVSAGIPVPGGDLLKNLGDAMIEVVGSLKTPIVELFAWSFKTIAGVFH